MLEYVEVIISDGQGKLSSFLGTIGCLILTSPFCPAHSAQFSFNVDISSHISLAPSNTPKRYYFMAQRTIVCIEYGFSQMSCSREVFFVE